MSDQTGGPAFPRPSVVNASGDTLEFGTDGMPLRDYFAAKAMQAYFAREHEGVWSMAACAEESYQMADAMLKARTR